MRQDSRPLEKTPAAPEQQTVDLAAAALKQYSGASEDPSAVLKACC